MALGYILYTNANTTISHKIIHVSPYHILRDCNGKSKPEIICFRIFERMFTEKKRAFRKGIFGQIID